MQRNCTGFYRAACGILVCGLVLAACSSPAVVNTEIGKLNRAPVCCRDLQELSHGSRVALAGEGNLNESSAHFEFASGKSPFVLADVPPGDGPRILEVRQRHGDAVLIDGVAQVKFLPISVLFLDGDNRPLAASQRDLILKQYSALSTNKLVRSVPIPPEARSVILFDDGTLLNRTVALPYQAPGTYLPLKGGGVVMTPGGTAMLNSIMVPYGGFETVILEGGESPAEDSAPSH